VVQSSQQQLEVVAQQESMIQVPMTNHSGVLEVMEIQQRLSLQVLHLWHQGVEAVVVREP
jgi:hypothetical protein